MTQGNTDISVGNGGNGTFTMGPGTSLNNQGQLWIGNNATGVGTVNMTGGTWTQHNWLSPGRANGNGTLNITGGTLTMDNASDANSHFDIAGGGGANLTSVGVVNQSAGSVTINNNAMWLGENLGKTGSATYNLTGGTLTTNAGITLGVSGSGTATFNINGGNLSTTGFAVGTSTGAKTITFNGGTLTALAASTTFLGGASVVTTVQAGGANINTNGFDETIATNLIHDPTAGAAAIDGGLTQTGAGTLTLGGNNTYTGATSVAGSLVFANTGNQTLAGNITVGGTLTQAGTGVTTISGTNTFTGGVAVTAGTLDALTPASLPGFGTANAVPVSAGATLAVGIGGANSFTTAQIDALRASGDFANGSNIGFDASQATGTATYASPITDTTNGTLGVTVAGGTVALTGANTYTGGTLLRGGFLNFANLGNLGTGGITFNGGSIQYAAREHDGHHHPDGHHPGRWWWRRYRGQHRYFRQRFRH